MKRFFVIAISFLSFFGFYALINQSAATPTTVFVEGKDYELVVNNANIPPLPKDTITVTEFFSYGCPWCYELEPQLQNWLKKKPANVTFERVPVIFEKYWDNYARAYYIAKALGVDRQITPKLFNAIQEQNKSLGSESSMKKFFISVGIKKSIVENAFQPSPTLDAQVKQGPQLMQAYQVYVIPAIVVDGKYRTDLRLAMDQKKLMAIVQYLVEKREAEKKI